MTEETSGASTDAAEQREVLSGDELAKLANTRAAMAEARVKELEAALRIIEMQDVERSGQYTAFYSFAKDTACAALSPPKPDAAELANTFLDGLAEMAEARSKAETRCAELEAAMKEARDMLGAGTWCNPEEDSECAVCRALAIIEKAVKS